MITVRPESPGINGLLFFSFFCWLFLISCKQSKSRIPAQVLSELELKKGQIISCGNDQQYGKVQFEISCTGELKNEFNLGMELLHSFEYEEAEKVFAKIITREPGCSMAYWGVAMCNLHLLWTAPTPAELKKGATALAIAKKFTSPQTRELDYIDALNAYYEPADEGSRNLQLEEAMEKLAKKYPKDNEASILYALSLNAAAEPSDKTYEKQKKAASILNELYLKEPQHPGILHYIIHTYDYPGLAKEALSQARRYAAVAPSSAHALHMPSHIFTRLGLWDECISSNLASIAAAKCYAESSGIQGHWDEELHGMDYLVYGWIQQGKMDKALQELQYLDTIEKVYPVNFKTAYAFAAIPARYMLEQRNWKGARSLRIHPADFPWSKFPWQEAIFHFARLLGAVQLGDLDSAQAALKKLESLRDILKTTGDNYKVREVEIQVLTGQAWISFRSGKKSAALNLMNKAADMEDSTEKHPVTPGEVIPARELLGDMLLELKYPQLAMKAYQSALEKAPNRRYALRGIHEAESKWAIGRKRNR
jgi:tetratricopeptide (TPR) repeat protein